MLQPSEALFVDLSVMRMRHYFFTTINLQEICMESILGFDSHDGNSWFDGAALHND
jgi:hypothetical protein